MPTAGPYCRIVTRPTQVLTVLRSSESSPTTRREFASLQWTFLLLFYIPPASKHKPQTVKVLSTSTRQQQPYSYATSATDTTAEDDGNKASLQYALHKTAHLVRSCRLYRLVYYHSNSSLSAFWVFVSVAMCVVLLLGPVICTAGRQSLQRRRLTQPAQRVAS